MKKLTAFLFLISIFSNCFSQYYDTSYFSATGTTFRGSWLNSSNNDKFGNVYHVLGSKTCQSCIDYSVMKIGSPSSWSCWLAYIYTADLKMYGDVSGNTYAFGTYSGYLKINGTNVDLYTDSNHYTLIKFDTIGKPLWGFVTNGTKISVNDSGYCYVLNGDSLFQYSPAGALVWARPSGGDQVIVNNNSSYYVQNSTGIKKYKSNGNLKWQLNTTSDFQVTYNGRCFLYGSGINELNPDDGSIIASFPSYANGIIFFDKNGNYYKTQDSVLFKYDSLGMVWNTRLTGTEFSHVGIDRNDNIYFENGYESHTYDQNGNFHPVKLFVPPDLYMNPTGLSTMPVEFPFAGVYVGKINQQHSFIPKIRTENVKALCKESVTDIPFSVNKYLVTYSNGMRAELSDSSGSFTNPMIIGSGNHSPIEANIPFFNISGKHYKVRVVAADPEIIGTPSNNIHQIVYKPQVSLVPDNLNYYTSTACAPVIISLQPSENLSYVWYKRDYGYDQASDYYPINNLNDSLTITSSVGDSYKAEFTDTVTGCSSEAEYRNLYTSGSPPIIDFSLFDTVCSNSAPVDLVSNYLNGTFSGNNIYNNRFFPDSAGLGSHPVHLHVNNAPSCYQSVDTIKYIYVDNCIKKIKTLNISPLKTSYCLGDTIAINFSYNPLLFNPGNKFIVQLGYYDSETDYFGFIAKLDSGISAPLTCVIPYTYNNDDYRIRVVSTDPVYIGTLNYDGFFKIGIPYTGNNNLLINQQNTYCGMPGSVISFTGYTGANSKYIWHNDNMSFIDSIYSYSGTSFYATQAGNYSVEIINAYGCRSFTDTAHIGIPSALITPNGAVTFCTGDSVILNTVVAPNRSYQWKKNGANISGATASSYTAKTQGTYKVTVTNTATGCSKTTISGIVVSVPCRNEYKIDNINSLDIVIYPNPSPDIFTIQTTKKIFKVTVNNLAGQTIFKKNFLSSSLEHNENYEIGLTNQPKGVYLIQVITDKEVYNQKIILD